MISVIRMAVVVVALVAASLQSALACPICPTNLLTLSEQLSQADAVVLVEWVEGTKPKDTDGGLTVYKVIRIVRAPQGTVKQGGRIVLKRYRTGQPGDLFLLQGAQARPIEWSSPLEVTETSFNYIVQSPSSEVAPQKRLTYFLKFLEFPDELVSNDAYAEFANAPYKDIAAIRDKMPAEKVRKWAMSKDTSPTRLGLYGLMIGLCGNEQDVKAIEAKIGEKTEDFRLGVDGLMSGYLLLSGAKGLDFIDKSKLKDKDIPFSETYAAMQALRFIWTYGDDVIEKDRLRGSMRLLLDRPELADLVIADLARWKDWDVQERLMKLYGADEYNIPSIKRAIVRYMLVCSKDVPKKDKTEDPKDEPKDTEKVVAELPKHVKAAKKHLETLRENDPKTVKDAERFFFLN